MNFTPDNFKHFGFEDQIDTVEENTEGMLHLYEGRAKDSSGSVFDVDVAVYKDDTFTMEVYRGDWRVLSIATGKLTSIYNIIGIIEILGMEMIR